VTLRALALLLVVPSVALAQTADPPPTADPAPAATDTSTAPPSPNQAATGTTGRAEYEQALMEEDRAAEQRAAREEEAEREAEEEEDEDSWGVFYLEALGGYSFANLVQFSQDNFIPEAEELSGSGLFGGLGAGFRIYWFTLGAQATIASYFGFEIGTVGADVAFHFPIPLIQPYVRVGVGYAWMGDANYEDPAASETDVYGLYVDGGLGLDIKLARVLSIGGGFDAVFLNMTRQEIDGAGTFASVNLEETGDAIGLQVRVHAHLTLHI